MPGMILSCTALLQPHVQALHTIGHDDHASERSVRHLCSGSPAGVKHAELCRAAQSIWPMSLLTCPSTAELHHLQIICCASENSDLCLRRSEKKALNELNRQAADQERERPGSSFMVRECRDSSKMKQRVSEPWEKSFILVRAALHDV
jgi:hypothetical protein